MSALTLTDFRRTGCQDFGNAGDPDMFHEAWFCLARPTDPEAAINVVREAIGTREDFAAEWLAYQSAEDIGDMTHDRLDPVACSLAWADSWIACAVDFVRREMPSWATSWAEAWDDCFGPLVCSYCGQRRTAERDECGGDGEGICEGYADAIDRGQS